MVYHTIAEMADFLADRIHFKDMSSLNSSCLRTDMLSSRLTITSKLRASAQ